MAIGERIKRMRNFRNLTQKDLGIAIGFAPSTADVRIAQYETGKRTPKEKYVEDIATVLNIAPEALKVPDIENYYGVMQTLFTLEDLYGLRVGEIDGEICLKIDRDSRAFLMMFNSFSMWHNEVKKMKQGEITREEYDNWRYRYPISEAERTKATLDAKRKKRKTGDSE